MQGIDRVFVYGPLANPSVLHMVLGRVPELRKASLAGFTRKTITEDNGQYVTVEPDDDGSKTVKGFVQQVSGEDLQKLDYFHSAYTRIYGPLGDGHPAWIYYYSGYNPYPVNETGMVKSAFWKKRRDEISAEERPAPKTLIEKMLSEIDLDALEKQAYEDLKSGKKTKRMPAVKKLRAIQGLRRNRLQPNDLLWDSVPVIPAAFRPFSAMGDTFIPGDANELYRDLVQIRNSYEHLASAQGMVDSPEQTEARAYLMKAVRAVSGTSEPAGTKTKQREVKGFLQQLLGKSPKYSFFQRALISKPQDMVGRGVAGVDPTLDIDEIGIPKEMAWDTFRIHGIRRLIKDRGLSPGQAALEWEQRTDRAFQELKNDVEGPDWRPIVLSRAPAWHRWNTVGQKARLVDGDQILANPYITTGLNLDFDGDEIIDKVLLLINVEDENQSYLKPGFTFVDCKSMRELYTSVPVFDDTKKALVLVDLEDFPRIEKYAEKVGENGPIELWSVPEGTQVLAHNPVSGKLEFMDVSVYSVHPDRVTELVHLRHGTTIITDDDPRAVYGIPENSTDLAFVRNTPTEAFHTKMVVPYAAHLSFPVTVTSIDSPFMDNHPLDFDFGYFLGAMAGDGWCNKMHYGSVGEDLNWVWNFSDLKGHNATALIRYFEKMLPDFKWSSLYMKKTADNGRYGDTVKYAFRSKTNGESICKFLIEHIGGLKGDNHTGCGSKKLPEFVYTAPREFREGVLCGLMDTDGSISVSEDKGKPQLLCAFTSTSLRLLRDIQFLARTLNIHSRISFSKSTSKDNRSWILNLSTVDCKTENVFVNLKTDCKRDVFTGTYVESSSPAARGQDMVAFPRVVEELLKKVVGCRRISEDMKKSGGSDLEEVRRQQSFHQSIQRGADNLLSRDMAVRVLSYLEDKSSPTLNDPLIQRWKLLVDNTDVRWTAIEEIEYTGKRETGYDLTVPGSETFTSVSGVILSNTLHIHPVTTPAAIREIKEKGMASKMVFDTGDPDRVVPMPKHEMIRGIYTSRMRPGRDFQFSTVDEAVSAFSEGKINLSDNVMIGGVENSLANPTPPA